MDKCDYKSIWFIGQNTKLSFRILGPLSQTSINNLHVHDVNHIDDYTTIGLLPSPFANVMNFIMKYILSKILNGNIYEMD